MKKWKTLLAVLLTAALVCTPLTSLNASAAGGSPASAEDRISSQDSDSVCMLGDALQRDELTTEEAYAEDSGEQTLDITGTYSQTEARSMLEMLNEYRTSGEAWQLDSDENKVELGTLTALKYDYDLEQLAMERAAEIALSYSHTTLEADYVWERNVNGTQSYGENIAAGYNCFESAEEVYEAWLETDENYNGQGHRRNMLKSGYVSIGIACFTYQGNNFWVQEFNYDEPTTSAVSANDSETTVTLKYVESEVESVSLSADKKSCTLKEGESTDLPTVSEKMTFINAFHDTYYTRTASPTWTSSDTGIAKISGTKVEGVKGGTATLTGTADGKSVTVTATVNHNYTSVVTSPTCSEQGYTTYTCSGCGDSYIDNYTDKTEHSYTKVVTEPTCTAEGYTTHTCSVCGDTYVDSYTDKTAHKTTVQNAKDATCTEEGYSGDEVCTVCGNTVSKGSTIAAKGHSWNDGEVTKAATEDTEGVKTYTCTVCGTTKTETIPKTSHVHSYTKVVTEPTCSNQGYTTYTCSCGDSYVSDYTDKLSHTYTKVVTDPTCTSQGYTTYTCSVCGDTYKSDYTDKTAHKTTVQNAKDATCTEEGYTGDTVCTVCGTTVSTGSTIAAKGHSWNDGEVTKAATEDTDGVKTYTCTVCGTTKTETIPKLSHVHSYTKVVTEPTCSEQGYTTYTCSCGDSYKSDYTDKLAHKTTVQNAKDATCTEEGYTGDTVCTVCGTVVSKGSAIKANGHDWDAGVITKEATVDNDGVRTYTCIICGTIKTETIPKIQKITDQTNGVVQAADGTLSYYENGKVQTSFTGFAQGGSDWYYVTNGKVDTSKGGSSASDGIIIQGTVNGTNGWWLVCEGKVNFTNTVAKNSNGWWYVVDGKVDFTYTGLAQNAYGWWRISKGKVDFNCTTVVKKPDDGTWWYVKGGKVQFGTTSVVKKADDNTWWYVKNGKVQFGTTSVVKKADDNTWWYVKSGKVQFGTTSVVKKTDDGSWWYVKSGKVQFGTTSVVKKADDNTWWYVKSGKVQFGTTGVVKKADDNTWWYVKSGKVNFSFTGIASNSSGLWYCQSGKVNFKKSGTVVYNHTTYTVKNGKVTDWYTYYVGVIVTYEEDVDGINGYFQSLHISDGYLTFTGDFCQFENDDDTWYFSENHTGYQTLKYQISSDCDCIVVLDGEVYYVSTDTMSEFLQVDSSYDYAVSIEVENAVVTEIIFMD